MPEEQEQSELDAIAVQNELHRERRPVKPLPKQPSGTELDVLLTMGRLVFLWGWLGTAISGGVLGSFIFPPIGTYFGLVYAAIAGFFSCFAMAALYVITRGRVSPQFAMTAAGALAGVGCAVAIGLIEEAALIAFIPGFFGAVGARWSTVKRLERYRLSEGRGVRSASHFSLRDMMLITVWFSAVLAVLQLAVRTSYVEWHSLLIGLLISSICAGFIEGIQQIRFADKRNRADA